MESNIHQLFVYGSLRQGFHHPMFEYISRYFSFIGSAKVKGKLYDMGEYPAGVPANDENYIIGELYAIKNKGEFSWAIGQLDDYEGINAEEGEISLYRRDTAEVLINEEKVPAWIYWFSGDTTGRPVIASGDVLQYIQQKNN